MKKILSLLCGVILCAAPAVAFETAKQTEQADILSEGAIAPAYNWINMGGGSNSRAAEYDYLKSTMGGEFHLEHDPLPHRFGTDVYYLNDKDFFGELDYAYRDVVVFNGLSRAVYHNLDHLTMTPSDPGSWWPTVTDQNPGAQYSIDNRLNRYYLRFKMPDFPLHLFADATTIDRSGTIQQRYLSSADGLHVYAQSRDIDWQSQDVKIGLNSHLGPVEAEYNHVEKKFESKKDNALSEIDSLTGSVLLHNVYSNVKYAADTLKLHTSYSGKVVLAGTYSSGDRTNDDYGVRASFRNTVGDVSVTPFGGLLLTLRFRQYALMESNAITTHKDMLTGGVRYRLSDRAVLKGEYQFETASRHYDATQYADWGVAHRTTKTTERIGLTYRVMNKLSLRGDLVATQVQDPAYSNDPDGIYEGKATLSWMPLRKVTVMASVSDRQEQRKDLSSPLYGGSRWSDRQQALGSVTMLVGKSSSVTVAYSYFNSKARQTLTFDNSTSGLMQEGGVPYGDRADVVSLSVGHALSDGAMLTGEASRCLSQGSFRLDGSVTGSNGIDAYSDMKIIEDTLSAGVEFQIRKGANASVRYQYRRYDDRIDNTQDGHVNTALTMLSMKW